MPSASSILSHRMFFFSCPACSYLLLLPLCRLEAISMLIACLLASTVLLSSFLHGVQPSPACPADSVLQHLISSGASQAQVTRPVTSISWSKRDAAISTELIPDPSFFTLELLGCKKSTDLRHMIKITFFCALSPKNNSSVESHVLRNARKTHFWSAVQKVENKAILVETGCGDYGCHTWNPKSGSVAKSELQEGLGR